MATLFKEKCSKGHVYRIQFVDSGKQRRSIRLGSLPKSTAESILSHVEEILLCQSSGISITAKSAVWLSKLGDGLHAKLANAGLVPKRQSIELNSYIRSFIERRKDVKKGTVIRWDQDCKKLVDFFGKHRKVDTITSVEAEKFKQHLFAAGLARATISKHLANSKMFFESMLEEKLIHSNPFGKTAVTAIVDESRNVYVPHNDVFKVVAAAPDLDWKLIISLSRFGGLRCPSEVLSLKWECIDWTRKRIIVLSPKTERHPNGSQRLISLFPELVALLHSAWTERKKREEYVIAKYRSQADADRGWGAVNLGCV